MTAALTSSYAGPACSHTCSLALLVHGGIGFTWEHDSHLLLKRAKLDEVLFGTPSWHRRRLADAVFPTLVAS
jgi:alkylation response protein AidB-like acyl-CoA dehydrogenase